MKKKIIAEILVALMTVELVDIAPVEAQESSDILCEDETDISEEYLVTETDYDGEENDSVDSLYGQYAAKGKCGDKISWTLDKYYDGTLTLSGTGAMRDYKWNTAGTRESDWGIGYKNLVINDGITRIGDYAFEKNDHLEELSLKNVTSLKSIGKGAFDSNRHLKTVTFPDNLTTIEESAFINCLSLEEVSFPDGLESIGPSAFAHCSFKGTVIIPDSVKTIGKYAFLSSGGYRTEKIVLPKNLTEIEEGTFSTCGAVSEIIIPDTVTSIGQASFLGCQKIREIEIPVGVTTIGDSAFTHCDAITELNIPAKVSDIGDNIVLGCENLEIITVDADNEKYDSREGSNAIIETESGKLIAGCKGTEIPFGVKSIGYSAFNSCKGLESIKIPSGVTQIDKYAFYGCENLQKVYLPLSTNVIDLSAFNNCNDITDVYYAGGKADWALISIADGNESLSNAAIHFNYEDESELRIIDFSGGYVFSKGRRTDGSQVYRIKTTSEEIFLCPKVTEEADYTLYWDGECTRAIEKNSTLFGLKAGYNQFFIKISKEGIDEVCTIYVIREYEKYKTEIKNLDIQGSNLTVDWNWDLFKADSTHYEENLYKTALYFSDKVEVSYYEAKDAFEYMGFGHVDEENYFQLLQKFDVNAPAVVFGSKEVQYEGKKKIVVAVSVRGTSDIGDVASDVLSVANGFKDAAENTEGYLDKYISRYCKEYEKSDIVLFLSGHSLGGATAGQLARLYSHKGYLNSNIYCYTFASPNYDIENDNPKDFKNVFNLVHENDTIPTLPYGYKKIGLICTYGNLKFSFLDMLTPMKKHVTDTYRRCLTEGRKLSATLGGEKTGIHCPVDISVKDHNTGDLIAKTTGANLEYYGDGSVLVMVEGDAKYIYSVPSASFDIVFTATDSGTMEYEIEKYNCETGEKLDSNVFMNIALEQGKTFVSQRESNTEVDKIQLYVINPDNGEKIAEVLNDGSEKKDYGDILESDIPADGAIPDGIWIAGITDTAYTGKNLTLDFRVYDGTVMLTPNKDYTVKYKNNKNAYTIADPDNLTANDKKKAPQMLITMKGNYSGKETVYFSINATGTNPDKPKPEQYPITGDKITITDTSGNSVLTAAYDKSGAMPALRLIYEDTILKEGRDYSLKYSGNTKYPVTKASVTITGMGNFNGKKIIPFTVTQRPFSTAAGISVVATDKAEGKKAGQYATTVKVFDSEGKLLKAGTDYEKTITYLKDGAELTKTDFPKAGDAITVRVTGKGGYTNNSIEATYNIVSAGQVNDIGKATFKIKPQQYNKGTAVTISEQEMFDQAFIGKGKTPLKLSTDRGVTGDFMVVPGSYTKNTTKGTAKVTFMGINGKTGTKTVSYSIGTRSVKDIWYGWIRQKKYYQTNEEILALIKQYCVNNMTSSSTDKVKEVDDYLSYRFIRSSDLGNGLYAYCADALVYRTYYAGMLIMPDGTIYNKETQPEMFEKYKDYFPSSITDFSTFWNKVKNDPTYVHGGFGDDEIDDEHKEIISKWTGTFRLDSQNAIEVLGVYEDGTIGFRLTVADASGESTVTNSYTAKFTNDAWTEFSIPYQSGINEIFRLEDTGIRVSLDIDMQGANDGLYVKM